MKRSHAAGAGAAAAKVEEAGAGKKEEEVKKEDATAKLLGSENLNLAAVRTRATLLRENLGRVLGQLQHEPHTLQWCVLLLWGCWGWGLGAGRNPRSVGAGVGSSCAAQGGFVPGVPMPLALRASRPLACLWSFRTSSKPYDAGWRRGRRWGS